MTTAIWAILVFCMLIFVHELGHFLVAKLCKITVHEFSIGMGPKLIGFTKGKTAYSVRILPLGGYVKLEGEDSASGDPNAFCNKSAFKRFSVLIAGAFMNVILGFLIFVIIFSPAPSVETNAVESIMENSAFDNQGIIVGDKIIKMEGDKYTASIHNSRDVRFFTYINGTNPANITFERDGKIFTKTIKPEMMEGNENPVFGITGFKYEKNSILTTLKTAYFECLYVIKSVFLSLWWLITGFIPASSMSGPVAIVGEIGAAAKMGWRYVFNLAAFISVNLGVMNLLPIPALDGGRILFLLIEKIRGKKMNSEKEGMINFVFFAILILLMLIVTMSDIKKLF